jgi:hypothetical protein
MFASQSISKVTNLQIALASKENQSLNPAFFTKMQGSADEMAAAKKPLPDDEFVSFLLARLGEHYDSLVAALREVKSPFTIAELFSHVQSYDQCKEMLASTNDGGFETSANAAARMRNCGGGYRPRNNNGRDDNRRYDDRPYDDRRDRRQYERRPDERRQDDRRHDDPASIKGAFVVDVRPLVVVVAVDMVTAAPLLGLMLLVRYVVRRAMPPRIVGIAFKMMMMMTCMHMVLIQIGIQILALHIISPVS